MPSIFYLSIIIIVGLIGSGLSVASMLKNSTSPYGLEINQWRADPKSGGLEANPYQRDLTAISGSLPLNANEAVTFHRATDDTGERLNFRCTYKISDEISNTRFWTLNLVDNQGRVIKPSEGYNIALYSQHLIFDTKGKFLLTLSPQPHSGNWLPIKGEGQFRLTLRMYDTPIVSNSEIFETNLPNIARIHCPES
jgi:hypothetical protein